MARRGSGDAGFFEMIDTQFAQHGSMGEDGIYTYAFDEAWLPMVRELGWTFAFRVRANHEARKDLSEDMRSLVPAISLPAARRTLKGLCARDLGRVFEMDVTISTGASSLTPHVSHWRNESTGEELLSVPTKELKKKDSDIVPVYEDAREVILIEAGEHLGQNKGKHDTVLYRGALYGRNSMEYRTGQSYRMLAQWIQKEEGKKSYPYIEMLSIRPLDMRPPFTAALAQKMHPGDTEEERMAHLERMAHSVAPATGTDHLWQKVGCLLSCVNGVPLADERHNVHTLLIGPPASGKTAISRPLADHVVAGGRFLDATRTTAAGLTYAEVTLGQTFALTPGAFITAPLIVLDEFNGLKFMDDIKMLIESQVVAYEKRLKGYRHTDCSIIGTCNPEDDKWETLLSIEENLPTIPWAVLSRFNIFLMPAEDDTRASNRNTYRSMRGRRADLGTAYTRDELSAYVSHARGLKPEITDACENTLLDYLDGDAPGAVPDEVKKIYGKRLVVSLMRNASAFAKLLLKPEVDAECAMLAIRLLTESIASFHGKTATVLRKASTKVDTARSTLQMLNEMHPKGWSLEMASAQLSAYSRYWPSERAAMEWLLTKFQQSILPVAENRYRWTEGSL